MDLRSGLKDLLHGGAAIVKTTREAVWRDEAATQALAQALAASPHVRNAFIELHGELGAGKTTFVRHLLRALGVQGRIKSPTYAVVEPYELAEGAGAFHIWHFDFYRFSDPREWAEAGFRDIFASPGLKLAEWPENVAGQLPLADLALHIAVLPNEMRQVTLTAQTPAGLALLQAATAAPGAGL
jgi:tRNA threonylcarbamoyladenosine biosynthesis protein TsaE